MRCVYGYYSFLRTYCGASRTAHWVEYSDRKRIKAKALLYEMETLEFAFEDAVENYPAMYRIGENLIHIFPNAKFTYDRRDINIADVYDLDTDVED